MKWLIIWTVASLGLTGLYALVNIYGGASKGVTDETRDL